MAEQWCRCEGEQSSGLFGGGFMFDDDLELILPIFVSKRSALFKVQKIEFGVIM